MNIDFWAARWKEGRIGFHEGRTNAFLERHVGLLGPSKRVLVPLCGKTEDMVFLAAQGHTVVGVEAVETAVKAFFEEHALVPEIRELTEHGKHIRAYSAGAVTIIHSDVLLCTSRLVGAVDALYDRAALIALAPDVRPRYVALVRRLLAPGSRGLLVSIEYDESKVEPPPHSVREIEVRSLYAGARVTQIDEATLEGQKFREANVVGIERCFSIEL